ncbi:hypothetical protein XGA_4261 [Xanthomonas hortorum ATCC 19865]|nr:hypothetical protein XGA_4261 [Xanthomonas hortorum ATCC 19865]
MQKPGAGQQIGTAAWTQTTGDKLLTDGVQTITPLRWRDAAVGEEGTCLRFCISQPFLPTTMQQIQIVYFGNQLHQRLRQRRFPRGAAVQRSAQARQRDFAQQRVAGCGLLAHTADLILRTHTLTIAVRIQRRSLQCSAPHLHRVADRFASGAAPVRDAQARCLCSQQAQAENRAAMGVDAAGGAQHRRFGIDTELTQACERGVIDTGLRNRDKVATQREQAAQEGGRVHIGVATGIERGDQAGLWCASQFCM